MNKKKKLDQNTIQTAKRLLKYMTGTHKIQFIIVFIITFRYLLPKTDFLLFKKQLLHIFDRYEKQNSNLKLNDLFEYMGFPSNWKEITKFRKI